MNINDARKLASTMAGLRPSKANEYIDKLGSKYVVTPPEVVWEGRTCRWDTNGFTITVYDSDDWNSSDGYVVEPVVLTEINSVADIDKLFNEVEAQAKAIEDGQKEQD